MVTGLLESEKYNLSIVNLWENDWVRPTITNMSTMQNRHIALPDHFRYQLVHKLFEKMNVPQGLRLYATVIPLTKQRVLRKAPDGRLIGWLPSYEPRQSIDDYIVSAMSKPFEQTASLGWDYSKKREVNRLFRNSKTALVSEDNARRVNLLHNTLKDGGVL